MKALTIIIVLSLVIGAYAYISYRMWHILPFGRMGKTVFTAAYHSGTLCLFLCYGLHFAHSTSMGYGASKLLYEVGNSSIFISLYLLLTFLAVDLLRLVRVLPKDFTQSNPLGTLGIAALMLVLFVGANINYNHKHREVLQLSTPKAIKKPLKLVMMSDVHLGYHNTRTTFGQWVDLINKENADLILIGGDLVDFSTQPLFEKDFAAEARRFNAPVYACLGNHEFLGGIDKAKEFYRQCGIHLLQDEAAVIGELGLCLVGRDDFTNRRRKKIPAIVEGLATDSLFTVVLDHQPFYLNQAEEAKMDFQFSGHTHYGQVWPINHLIDHMYECGYGPWQRGGTRYYVSSGMGIWGAKFRIGTRSEYVVAEITPAR